MRKTTRSKRNIRALKAIIEAVEQRTLLSATVANGVLTVNGTSAADVITVGFNLDFSQTNGISTISGTYTTKVNGVSSNYNASPIQKVIVNGLNGNDSIAISGSEQDNNAGAAPVGLTVNEGDGNDGVSVVITGAGVGASTTVNITAGNGNDSMLVQGGNAATVTAGNGNDTLGASANIADLDATFNAGNGNDQINGISPGGASLSIHANVGTGHDTFNNNNDPDISVTGQTSDGQSVASARNSVSFGGHVAVATPTGSVPLANAIVFIDGEGTGVLSPGDANVTTDAQGNYEFSFNNTGDSLTSHVVVNAPGYTFTPLVRTETVTAGIAVSGDDFALTPIRTTTATNPILIGTAGSYNNQGNTIANAVDGNLSTFFDSPTASGGFVALDYGLPQTIKQISFAPRSTLPGRMVGGVFQGSNSSDFSNAVTLYTVTSTPAVGKLTTVNISNSGTFRYVRYLGPANGYCNIAEMKFTLATNLTGIAIGTAGSYHNGGSVAAHAFDGDLNTFFDAPDASGDWAGLDLGSAKIITKISFAPRKNWSSRMVGGIFQASNSVDFSSGVVTLYTVPAAPATGVLTTVQIVNYSAYRYVRYIGPANSYCDIAEAQFSGTTPVAGAFLQANGTLVVNGSAGADTIILSIESQDSPNSDTVTATINGAAQTFSLASVLQITVNAGAGNDNVTLNGFDEGGGDTGHGFEAITVNGGDGDDTITNNIQTQGIDPAEPLLIDGGAGNDTIFNGGDGTATLIGGDGNDTFSSSGYPGLTESIYGGDGNDTVFADGDTTLAVYDGGGGNNTLDFTHNATPTGQVFDVDLNSFVNVHNVVLGDLNDVTVVGTSGDDTITDANAGEHAVSIIGGGGNDTESISVAESVTIDDSGSEDNHITMDDSGTVNITGGDGNDAITVTNSQNVSVNGSTGDDVINVRGNVTESVDGGPGFDTAYTDPGATVTNVESLNPAASAQLTGALIGTSGSYNNQGNTAVNVFDGSLFSFFDAPDASGDWVGMDLGPAKIITQISFAPRNGLAGRMVGGMFQASNTADFSSGVVTLYTVTSAPPSLSLTTVQINNPFAYQYVRYIGPANGYCNVAEVQFFGATPATSTDTAGNLDVSFGGGQGYVAAGKQGGGGGGITVLPNGQFLVVSGSSNSVDMVSRYNADGSLDSTFGVNGSATAIARIQDIYVQASGDIVVAGIQDNPELNYLEGFLPNGKINTSFGSQHNGVIVINFGSATQNITLLKLLPLPSGQFIVGGSIEGSTAADARFALERFNANGTVDTSFGGSGTGIASTDVNPTTSPMSFNQSDLTAVALAANGDILAAGQGSVNSAFVSLIVRYTANGILDTGFGPSGTGIVITSIGQDLSPIAIRGLANGQFIVAGEHLNAFGAGQFGSAYALRYNADGSIDPTYSQSTFQPSTNDSGDANAALIYPDGSVLFGGQGHDSTGNPTGAALFRITASGTPDTTFNGISAETQFGSTDFFSLALTSDSRILALTTGGGTTPSIFVTRYLGAAAVPAGSSLSSNGILNVIGSAESDVITVNLSSDGKSIVATLNGQPTDFPIGSVKGIRIDALNGDDSVTIAPGVTVSSTIFGGEGNDTLSVSGGSDSIFGDDGDDVIFANDGSPTTVNGGAGDDTAVVDAIDTVTDVETDLIG